MSIWNINHSARLRKGENVGSILTKSNKQSKQLEEQQDRVSSRRTRATGAAGVVNSECYDFKSITLDKVKKITTSKKTYEELNRLVGESSKSGMHVDEY